MNEVLLKSLNKELNERNRLVYTRNNQAYLVAKTFLYRSYKVLSRH